MEPPLSILLALAFHQRPIFYQCEPESDELRKTRQKVPNSSICEKQVGGGELLTQIHLQDG